MGKKSENDDLFLILYEIEICWRYGMAVLHPARTREVYAPKRHKHPISDLVVF